MNVPKIKMFVTFLCRAHNFCIPKNDFQTYFTAILYSFWISLDVRLMVQDAVSQAQGVIQKKL